MFKLFVFAAVLAFAAATADPGVITSYASSGYLAPGYAAPLGLAHSYYGGYASPYAYNGYNGYNGYNAYSAHPYAAYHY